MRKINTYILSATLIVIGLTGINCTEAKVEHIKQVSNNVAQLIGSGAKIFDVRTAQEFASGAYPNAINIPLQEVESRLSEFGNKTEPIIVYCASGARSSRAKQILQNAGYTNVTNGGGLREMPRQ